MAKNGIMKSKRYKSQRGFTTVEFLFAFVIAFGLTMLTFSLTLSLSVVEVAQYIVYSSSRAHAASNFDKDAQQKAGRTKYSSLINSEAMAPLFQNGWYKISSPAQLEIRSGGGENFEKEYGGTNSGLRKFYQGVRANLRIAILEMKIPLLGSVAPEDSDVGFSTKINSMMIREVSHSECLEYMKNRSKALWTFDGANRFSKFENSSATPWEDNGC